MYVEVFLVGILAGLSPGPDFFVVMKNSLGYGQRIGIATAFGIAFALLIHIAYTVLGFTYVIQTTPQLFIAIKLAGASYLLWLGFQAIRAKPNAGTVQSSPQLHNEPKSLGQAFREGFLCNALNPKAALFFLSVFSQFISEDTARWMQWVYGAEIIAAVGLWFVLLAIMISYRTFRELYQKYTHWLDRSLGAVLIYFAVVIVFTAF
ncbi:LysE family transporter [Aneurinibacillus sp. BA2021]|nr:LysE family transporter [Aneurinibacillus sp. BA2021]